MVEHGSHAPAGLLADWAASRSLRIQTVALHAGEPLPAAPDCDAAAILGSELTAYDDTLPWLAAELAFIERMLAASVPVLGICFGAQALARVLGARLYRLPEPEIGWAQVTSAHPGLAEGPWLSWHRDAFDLPRGRGPARRERGVRAGVLLRPAHRRAVPPGGDPADRRVVGAASPRRHRARRSPARCSATADGAWQRAAVHALRAVLRLAGRRPDRPENGLTGLQESRPWKHRGLARRLHIATTTPYVWSPPSP